MTVDLLTIDAGNSTIVAVRHGDGARASVATDGDLGSIRALWAPGMRVVVASVVAAATHRLRELFRGRAVALEFVGDDLACPLHLDYEPVETLGVDRWLGALAGHHRFGSCVTVDCGTATTVNFVSRDGRFEGGAIGPGLSALAAGLAAKAPSLPLPDLNARPVVPARNSQASVEAGVLLGYAGLVERLVAEVKASRDPAAAVVLTGGNARRVHAHVGFEAHVVPDLVHEGMALLVGWRACAS